jgi:hypothetical protein
MVSKAPKIRQSEGIELLREIAFFRNLLTNVLLPPLLAKRPVLDRRWKVELRRGCLSCVAAKVQNRSEFEFDSSPSASRIWGRRTS